MLSPFFTWLVATLVFVGFDMVWLGKIMNQTYLEKLGHLAELSDGRIKFNLGVGLLVQVIIITGIVVILFKALNSKNTLYDFVSFGAFVGFVIYATYDGTNLSFMKNWPLDLTIIDILWGTFQGAVGGFVVWFLHFRQA